MNVTFHALASVAVFEQLRAPGDESVSASRCVLGASAGLLTHGILDGLPHQYPLGSTLDVVLAVVAIAVLVSRQSRPNAMLLLACFAGAVLPDVVDLGPAILAHHLGISVPHLGSPLFPWHRPEGSGSLASGVRTAVSWTNHVLVVALCGGAIALARRRAAASRA